jgi:hypothetical protein
MSEEGVFRKEVIELIMRQTEYDEATTISKLKHYKGDVVQVIREFMGGKKSSKKVPSTTNQKVFGEIRSMMDDASERYRRTTQKGI